MGILGKINFNFGIRTKLLAGFFLVLAFVTGAGVATGIMLDRITTQADFILEASTLALDVSEDLKQSVYRIQHLTVESAVSGDRGAAGQAEKWASRFTSYLKGVPPKCQACHAKILGTVNDDIGVSKISKINGMFQDFRSKGKLLHGALQDPDKDVGHSAMKSFESSAELLVKEVNSLSQMSRQYQTNSSSRMKEYAFWATRLTRWGTVIALVIGLALALLASSRISAALNRVTLAAERIAGGILSDSDLDKDSNDEMGTLTIALNKMRQSLRNTIGGLTHSGEMVADSSDELSTTVGTIKGSIENLSHRAENVATSTTEMSQTVLDIARNASSIAASADEAMDTARDGAEVVGQTVREVQEISRSVQDSSNMIDSLGRRSNQIGEIVGVINDIADQTNLLALNAAIEAARAGEQGRGFAVVADEVRKLAERTGKATTEISGMIVAIQGETTEAVGSMNESQKRVQSGTDLAGRAEVALKKIVDSVHGLMEMVQQIASSTEEMSTTAEMVSSELETMATDSHQTDNLTGNISKAADDLMKLSKHLRTLSDSFEI